jgi:predicted DNA-binding transcriptional regulator YafY
MLSDMLPTERIARAVWLLASGESTTVRHLAERLEITPRGARSMLEKISRVIPLVDDGGVWRLMDALEDGEGEG